MSTALACDCARLASAAFQTFFEVDQALAQGDDLPWALIKAYYAAFYAGHALLRVLGATCTYVDGSRASLVRRVIGLYGVPAGFDRGLYDVSLLPSGSALRFRAVSTGSGGTHEAFWSILGRRLKVLEEATLRGPLPAGEGQAVFLSISALRAVLSRNALLDSWLSNVRNAVQYRHELGVWYPSRASRTERRILSRIAGQWLSDPCGIDLQSPRCGDLGPFLAACTFLVSWCRVALTRVGEISTGGRSFVHYGPLAYLAKRAR